jgi:putative transposase
MDQAYRMRAVLVPLNPTPAQEQLLRSYCGASRFAYNWTVAIANENMDTRQDERRAGIDETDLTKPLLVSVVDDPLVEFGERRGRPVVPRRH